MATLANALGVSDTTITISSGTLAAKQILTIDSEYANVVAVLTPTQGTIKRGIRGTLAAAHAVGATVTIDTGPGPAAPPPGGVAVTPAGTGQVQFNNAGTVAGDANLTWLPASRTLQLPLAQLAALTVAQLPASPTVGTLAYVSDASVSTWGTTFAGSGSNKVLAWYNGTAWTIVGK